MKSTILHNLPIFGRYYRTIARLNAERVEALRRVEESEAARIAAQAERAAAEAEIRAYCDRELRRLHERLEAAAALNRALARERDMAAARLPDLTLLKGSVDRIAATLTEKRPSQIG